jgi:hypothetical protein
VRDLQELIDVVKNQPLEDWRFYSKTDQEKNVGCALNYAGEVLGYGKAMMNSISYRIPCSTIMAIVRKEGYLTFLLDFGLGQRQVMRLMYLNDFEYPQYVQGDSNDITKFAERAKQRVIAYLKGVQDERLASTH